MLDVAANPTSIAAFVEREHEFRFTAVSPLTLEGDPTGTMAVLCTANTDEEYRSGRCPPEEFARRWAVWGIDRIWRDDVLPCRVYLRHCVLAASRLCPEANDNFLDHTFLADRTTTIREYLKDHPDIMEEQPPESLRGRYSG